MTMSIVSNPTRYTLYFRNWSGNLREIASFECFDESDARSQAHQKIMEFCSERNFTVYYIRMWNADGMTIYDVGSHSEFFHLSPCISIRGADHAE